MPRRTATRKDREHPEEMALPPCPKCGGEGREVGNYLTAMICSIYCKRCGWHVTGMADTIAKCREEALKAWAEPAAEMPGSGISGAGGLLDED